MTVKEELNNMGGSVKIIIWDTSDNRYTQLWKGIVDDIDFDNVPYGECTVTHKTVVEGEDIFQLHICLADEEQSYKECLHGWRNLYEHIIEGNKFTEIICEKSLEEKVSMDKCKACPDFSCKHVKFPIQVEKIEYTPISYNDSVTGSLVAVKPCADEYEGKTYLGILLGHLPTKIYSSHTEDCTLEVSTMLNPAIYVFELKKVIFGYESWWSTVKSVDDFKEISDKDIDNTWYVQLLKAMYEK